MPTLDRYALLDECRRVVAQHCRRRRDVAKLQLPGDIRILSPRVRDPRNIRHHNGPSWDRMLIWLKRLGYDVEYKLVSRHMPFATSGGEATARPWPNAREVVRRVERGATKGGNMRLVVLESPFAGDVTGNIEYARRCVRDALSRGEAPIASHLLYTQTGILNDLNAEERQWGIDAGLAWIKKADATVVYTDRGISSGMAYGIKAAQKAGVPVEYRSLPEEQESEQTKARHFPK